tara:strand:- start:998 stop:2593 length:1596 start_codon:yes stop_codon:yes gene_type:complete
MKKIKAQIIDFYNRYIISTKNIIIKKIKLFFSLLIATFVSILSLNFMASKNVKISLFSRYLILLIILLFSFLFYLSIPTIYNYSEVQKDLNDKLLEEFNLNTVLSANIIYKILPSPNFEISNVLLTTKHENKFDDFAEIKKMNVYINLKNFHNQKKIKIRNVVISEANININNSSFNYINNYFKEEMSDKKVLFKKSKIFFRENNSKKDLVTLSTIKNLYLYHDKKNNINKINIDGSIYNTKYNLTLQRNIFKKDTTKSLIKFKDFNALIKSTFSKNQNKQNMFNGRISLNFSASEINTIFKIENKLISFESEKSKLNNNNINFKGNMNISPFYYNLNISLERLNILKFFQYLSRIKNLVDDKILLNKKVNGNMVLKINSLKETKFLNSAKINFNIINGKFFLNDSSFTSDKIGKIFLEDAILESIENKKVFKSKIFFKILNQKKFYQKLQIPKSSRINLNNIYCEIEKDLDIDEVEIVKLVLNKKMPNTSIDNSIDLTNSVDINEIIKVKNWIELKKFSNQIFSEINQTN